jgi:pimeloyl-ACP methyl ester carboxylesterase
MPTFVLVPGAWFGGWCWHPVACRLRERGFEALPVTLPGLSYGSMPDDVRLAHAVDALAGELVARDLSDVVLVGHSWGGYPVTGAAHAQRDRIRSVVYYNAVVPAAGVAMADENPGYGEQIRAAITARPDHAVPLPFEAIAGVLMPGVPADTQRLVADLVLPQPGSYTVDPLDLPTVTEAGLSAAYVLGQDDQALARPGTEFAARLGVEPILIPGGHMTLLTDPETVTEALINAA